LSGRRREEELYRALQEDDRGGVAPQDLSAALERCGLRMDDPRLRGLSEELARREAPLDQGAFTELVCTRIGLVDRALSGKLVVPDFPGLRRDLDRIYDEARAQSQGEVADYIPQLSRVAPDQFGVSLCTIDGQRYSRGEANTDFCIQSCCKPINYCLALEAHGVDGVHRYVGREPSGHHFNEITLNAEGKPHNPMINAGAIMSCALIEPEASRGDRFDAVMERWRALAGGEKAGFSNAVYQSERETGDRNFALAYFMREHGAFPEGTDLVEVLEFYFQCCAIEQTTDRMAVVAATLAAGGVNPLTGERLFSPATVKHCLSLMASCGMYDFSGEFAFSVGLPAKSGVSGALLIVVPNIMGICTWSPRLDKLGNSVRGVAFCEGLLESYRFHAFDDLTGLGDKADPTRRSDPHEDAVVAILWAASRGDLDEVHRLLSAGVDVNAADYDGRTPLHLAAAEGWAMLVRYLLAHGAQPDVTDRWGHPPLEDARRGGHTAVEKLLS